MAVEIEDLAQLMLGIAQAENAIIRAIDQQTPGFSQHVIGTLQGTSGMGRNPRPPATLEELPAHILLQSLGGQKPTLKDWVLQELHARLKGA